MDLKKLNYKVEVDSIVQYIFIATSASPDSVELSKQLHKVHQTLSTVHM